MWHLRYFLNNMEESVRLERKVRSFWKTQIGALCVSLLLTFQGMYAYSRTLTESGGLCLFSPFSPRSPGLSQSLFSLWGCPAFLVSRALPALSCLLPTQPSPAPARSRQCCSCCG